MLGNRSILVDNPEAKEHHKEDVVVEKIVLTLAVVAAGIAVIAEEDHVVMAVHGM